MRTPRYRCRMHDRLLQQLRALGVRSGDTLMVHASMRAVGARAEVLLDALQTAVGDRGALLMLVCCPEGPFDPATSPAWDELGVLSEVFRTRPGVVLNAHPVARMGAWGHDAAGLVQDPPLDDYYGPGSPLERLAAAGGRVLRLGADPDTVTLFHHAEYLARVPRKRRRSWEVEVVGPQGAVLVRGSCLDDNHGIRDHQDGVDYFPALLAHCRAEGLVRAGPVGGAQAELLDARPALACAVDWLEATFGL